MATKNQESVIKVIGALRRATRETDNKPTYVQATALIDVLELFLNMQAQTLDCVEQISRELKKGPRR